MDWEEERKEKSLWHIKLSVNKKHISGACETRKKKQIKISLYGIKLFGYSGA